MSKDFLSIIIPTADRHEYLQGTISNLLDEIERTGKKIKIIVVDNASKPPIEMLMLGEKARDSGLVSIKRFENRVEVGESIMRSSMLAESDFVWVFGDDDMIVDGGMGLILDVLEEERPDYVYVNRYIATNDMGRVLRTEHDVTVPFLQKFKGVEAVRRFTHHPGFITSLVVRKGLFNYSQKKLDNLFPGYGFLAALYVNTLDGKVCYISVPLVVQRKSLTLWRRSWPYYWLVSVPSLFKWLDGVGAKGAYESVCREVTSLPAVLYTATLAKASGTRSCDDFWNAAAKYQKALGKVSLYVIRFFLPSFLAKLLIRIGARLKG